MTVTTTDAGRRTAAAVLASCREQVEPALRAAVDTLPGSMRHISGYHLGRWDPDGRPSGAGGKAIRPALTVLCAAAVGGSPEAAVPAAVAVELVHNFSLLHDDVMDRDLTRRHRPTAWVLYGMGPAILAGDALLTLAMDVLAAHGDGPAVRALGAVVQELVDGQVADLDFERRCDVGVAECLAMAEGKTGALLGGACALGAAAGGATDRHVRELERFGRELGLAFQLVDDLLGIWGDPATTGKPVGNEPVYVRKQIVHNAHVVADLEARGAVFVDELYAVPDGAPLVFSAHGVSPAVRRAAAARGLEVTDATCPLVAKVHTEARRFADRGDTIVLIGHAGHEETVGTLGEVPEHTVLVESVADVDAVQVPDPERVSYLMQTTLAVDEAADIVAALRARFPALRGPGSDDICYATTNRQRALAAIAAEADLVLVVGSANSSNSVRLVELSRRHGTPAHLIEDAGDIRAEWLDGARTVGVTAGASAPPPLVDAVVAALRAYGPVVVEERETARETVRFLPVNRTGRKYPQVTPESNTDR